MCAELVGLEKLFVTADGRVVASFVTGNVISSDPTRGRPSSAHTSRQIRGTGGDGTFYDVYDSRPSTSHGIIYLGKSNRIWYND